MPKVNEATPSSHHDINIYESATVFEITDLRSKIVARPTRAIQKITYMKFKSTSSVNEAESKMKVSHCGC